MPPKRYCVIVDWVPGHFPKDGHGLAYLIPHLYEHADRMGEHKEGTLVFNYSRHEVRNFLVSNALFGLTSTTLRIQWMSPPCFTWTIVVSQENGFPISTEAERGS